MRCSKEYFFLLIGFVLSTGLPKVYSQEEEPKHVFRAISLDEPISDLALVNEAEVTDFFVPSHRRSTVMTVDSQQGLRFVESGSVVPEAGVSALPTLLQVPVAENLANPLYIFYPNPESGPAPYGVFPIEDNHNRFTGGMSLFINLSPYPMVLLLGDQSDERIELNPLQKHLHEFEEDSVNVRLRIATYASDSVQKGMDTRVFPVPTHRDIYFIYPVGGDGPGLVRMRLLREHGNAAKRAYVVEEEEATPSSE